MRITKVGSKKTFENRFFKRDGFEINGRLLLSISDLVYFDKVFERIKCIF